MNPGLPLKELKRRVRVFLACRRNLQVAAVKLGVSAPTLREALKRAVRLKLLDKLAASGRGGPRSIVKDPATRGRVLEALQASGWRMNAAAKAYGVSEDHFRRLARQTGAREDLERRKAAETDTLDAHIDLSRARSEASDARSRLSDALREINRLRDRVRDLEWVSKASLHPADWTLKPRRAGGKSEHIPYLLTSDFQIGEVIRTEETDHAYGYDVATFRSRYRRMIETSIYLSFEHAGGAWTYPGIVYARGGDTLSGQIHDELRETDEVTPIQAAEIAYEEEAAGIAKLVEAFGRVDVKDCGGGNHDRTTLKPQAKRATAHSYDRLISVMLRREFAKDDRVTFQTTESPDVVFPIYAQRILLTHGDKIGSRGGHGFVGPVATIVRGAQRIIMEQAALGRHIDRVDMGHFHTPMYLGWVLVNGGMPGYSEYAKQARLRPSPPQQTLVFHHAKHGVVDLRPIMLEKPK